MLSGFVNDSSTEIVDAHLDLGMMLSELRRREVELIDQIYP
jgi:hypothetical protein